MSKVVANDEINLVDICFRLWSYKLAIIAAIFISCSYAAVYYIIKVEKIYSATGIFIPETDNTPPTLVASALSKIGNFAGFEPTNDVDQLVEKFSGRNFLSGVSNDLKLSNDRFYNTYNPNSSQPAWKVKLKSILNWKSNTPDPSKLEEWVILQNIQKHVEIQATKADAIQVTVEHPSAERAAEIANHIMNKGIVTLKSEKDKQNKDLIDYLSNNLAEALINFEIAEDKLKKFMISNSADASAGFYKGSILLDEIRPQLKDTKDQIRAIDELLSHAEKASPTFQDYVGLAKRYPVIDDSDFRRILGISEIRSAWTWPRVETLKRVQNSLRDRARSLENEKSKHETESKQYALIAEQHGELLREVKIAESVYKLLIEQTKSQSLSVGFSPDTSIIISAAKVQPSPSKPDTTIVIALAGGVGFFVSALLVLGFSWYRGAIYSKGELLSAIDPKFHHQIRPLRYYRANNLIDAQQRLSQRPAPWLKQLCLETFVNQEKPIVMVADSTNANNASIISRLIVASAHDYEKSLAYIDLSKRLDFQYNDQNKKDPELNTNIHVSEFFKDCIEYNYKSGKQNVEWLFTKSFQENLDLLYEKHDMVLFSSDLRTLEILHSSGQLKQAKIVLHASLRKTKYKTIEQLKQQGSIEIALFT